MARGEAELKKLIINLIKYYIMTEDDLLEFIREWSSKITDPLLYSQTESFLEMGLDSLDFVDLIMSIEDRFHIIMPVDFYDMNIDQTPQGVAAIITKMTNRKP